ncbi:MAG TPA: ribulose-phosphate 3-epimerase [Dehalococcoidia bacterium]|nr:ribulose-phosphate 3-epimerase [Dehalococcoidia bacterium]
MSSPVKIAPSILSADYLRLGEQVREAEAAGADYIHVDVMDGHFVPNITIGPVIVEAVRRQTALPLDVHLMIEEPERHVEAFAQAGASILTVHPEATQQLHRTIQMIRRHGVRPGVVLNPGTSVSLVEDVLGDVDLVLVMSVDPGFGGQEFIEHVLPKVRRLRRLLDEAGLGGELEIDGGITVETAPRCVEAGARVLVAGTAIFNERASVAESIARLRESAVRALEVGG